VDEESGRTVEGMLLALAVGTAIWVAGYLLLN
jgi:hypothetical protein